MKHLRKYSLREAISDYQGFAYLIGKMEILTPIGNRLLYETEWITDSNLLEKDWTDISFFLSSNEDLGHTIDAICRQLMCVRDISGTLAALHTGQILDDIGLFELKALALTSQQIRAILQNAAINVVSLPDLEPVISVLDPEGSRIPHFYIYDAYSEELKQLRSQLNAIQNQKYLHENTYDNKDIDKDIAALTANCFELEQGVREELSQILRNYSETLTNCLRKLGHLDLIIAKAKLTEQYKLIRPTINNSGISYKELRNPQVADALIKENRHFQPIDIFINKGVTIITGSNMAGKSIVLKTVAICQLLAQFGFYVPAKKATLTPVDTVMTSIGDAQSELEGLSSYAAEMLRINEIFKKIREGKHCLALIDEPARTTNPEEGKALVNAIIEILKDSTSFILLTTHYSGLKTECRRLRVKGFRKHTDGDIPLSITNINNFIDYSLEESTDDKVPHEALRIARLLGIEPDITQAAARYIELN